MGTPKIQNRNKTFSRMAFTPKKLLMLLMTYIPYGSSAFALALRVIMVKDMLLSTGKITPPLASVKLLSMFADFQAPVTMACLLGET